MPVLEDHLRAWVGVWPPPQPGRIWVIAADVRTAPGWDGAVRPVLGVVGPDTVGGVVCVQPGMQEGVVSSVDEAASLIGVQLWEAAFRWSEAATALPDTGEWVAPDDPRVPDWLRPFNGGVLLSADPETGLYAAGVGVKRHDDFGHEISVGTDPAAQGRGLARRLVATAARRILADGAVPTYLHDFRNTASAKVAEAAGFPDRGWRVVGSTPG